MSAMEKRVYLEEYTVTVSGSVIVRPMLGPIFWRNLTPEDRYAAIAAALFPRAFSREQIAEKCSISEVLGVVHDGENITVIFKDHADTRVVIPEDGFEVTYSVDQLCADKEMLFPQIEHLWNAPGGDSDDLALSIKQALGLRPVEYDAGIGAVYYC